MKGSGDVSRRVTPKSSGLLSRFVMRLYGDQVILGPTQGKLGSDSSALTSRRCRGRSWMPQTRPAGECLGVKSLID